MLKNMVESFEVSYDLRFWLVNMSSGREYTDNPKTARLKRKGIPRKCDLLTGNKVETIRKA